MRRLAPALAALALASALPALARAGDVPSCYAANRMTEAPAPAPRRAVFLLIDETTLLNTALQGSAWKAVAPLIEPGTELTVVRFSAYSQSRYTTTVFSGLVEEGVPEAARHAISVKKLKQFDDCLAGQRGFVVKKVQAAMAQGFASASGDLAKSDVIAAMNDVSVSVRASQAPQKVVLAISDMLENSTISSFYENNGVRAIDPAAEMGRVRKAGMLGDFAGARVWVMGAGLIAADTTGKKTVYRDPIRLKSLQNFWTEYFSQSKATLADFGTPELKQPIR
ncbi:hypothetical protein ACLB1G_18425 [Oxalobacteraceae bacterium A2-2]